jgi:hypothetical protein
MPGLIYWCNSGDVPQIGAVVNAVLFNVFKPAPIIGLFSTSPSSNRVFLSQGSPKRIIKSREKKL